VCRLIELGGQVLSYFVKDRKTSLSVIRRDEAKHCCGVVFLAFENVRKQSTVEDASNISLRRLEMRCSLAKETRKERSLRTSAREKKVSFKSLRAQEWMLRARIAVDGGFEGNQHFEPDVNGDANVSLVGFGGSSTASI
jgi:hypothetical protein